MAMINCCAEVVKLLETIFLVLIENIFALVFAIFFITEDTVLFRIMGLNFFFSPNPNITTLEAISLSSNIW